MDSRKAWVDFAHRYALPVLDTLANDQHIPWSGNYNSGQSCQNLEAFSRVFYSLSPWFNASYTETEDEEHTRRDLIDKAKVAFHNLFDGESKVSAVVNQQAVVDYAYLSWGVLNYPELLETTSAVRSNFWAFGYKLRDERPLANNWMLLSAITEIVRAVNGRHYDAFKIDAAIRFTLGNYKGDGIYGDGEHLHLNYYNSLVIHPALDTLYRHICLGHKLKDLQHLVELLRPQQYRSRRYAEVLERQISPEGTFPVIGRSATYRLGAFHHLAHTALRAQEPSGTRSALSAVLARLAPTMFRWDGFLQVGFAGGENLNLAEPYVNTASVYATGYFLLPLGLPPNDEFWTAGPALWTQARLWGGDNSMCADSSYMEERLVL